MRRVTQLCLVAALAALLSPAVASSAPRMYIGFHDDVAFRWNPNRAEVLGLRYGLGAEEPQSLEEIGRRLGITRERVRQIEATALERLAVSREIEALRTAA